MKQFQLKPLAVTGLALIAILFMSCPEIPPPPEDEDFMPAVVRNVFYDNDNESTEYSSGLLYVRWTPVPNAQAYEMYMKLGPDGASVRIDPSVAYQFADIRDVFHYLDTTPMFPAGFNYITLTKEKIRELPVYTTDNMPYFMGIQAVVGGKYSGIRWSNSRFNLQ
jgi:hypothetical protein